MPRVPLPQDFESYLNDTITQGSSPIAVSGNGAMSIRGPNGRDQAIVYIGAIFDGYRFFENFTSALPGFQINFYKTFISQLSTPSTTSSTTTTTTTSTPSRPSCKYSILFRFSLMITFVCVHQLQFACSAYKTQILFCRICFNLCNV